MEILIQYRLRNLNLEEEDKVTVRNVKNRSRDILSCCPPLHDPSPMLDELAHMHRGFEHIVVNMFFRLYGGKDRLGYNHVLSQRLCWKNPAFIIAFESYLVEQCTRMQEMEMEGKRLANLARAFANLLKAKNLSWRILAYFCFDKSAMSQNFLTFGRTFFQELAVMDEWTIVEMLMDRDVLQSIEAVYPERGKRDTPFFIDYFDSLGGFLWITHTLQMRVQKGLLDNTSS